MVVHVVARTFLLALILLGIATLGAPAHAEQPADPPGIKLYVDRPGVYAVSIDRIFSVAGGIWRPDPERLRLSFRGRKVPYWLVGRSPGHLQRLLFIADTAMFRPRNLRSASPLTVLRLTWGEGVEPDALGTLGKGAESAVAPKGMKKAKVERHRHFEKNVLRASLTAREGAEAGTIWYWSQLTQRASSHLDVELGRLADRERGEGLTFELKVRLLGWSREETPTGVFQHRVDLLLNGRRIAETNFEGRRSKIFEVDNLPVTLLRDGQNVLRLKIPQRKVSGEADPLVDLVYVDWVEIGYRASSPLADATAPLVLDASSEPRWLADPRGASSSHLLAVEGWTVKRSRSAGWVLPPGPATKIWIVDGAEIHPPLAVERLATGARSIPANVQYVMIAPPPLLAETNRLAEFHRLLGQTVAVVNVNAVYDQFGWGARSPEAIRRFLGHQFKRSGKLRWVLLVGDADWFEPDDREPYLKLSPSERNWIPTWTDLSRYGLAASDHYFAMQSRDGAAPRFAIGRIPVVDAASLRAYVSKVIAWAGTPRAMARPSMLMLTDSSRGSRLQQRRLRERFSDAPLDLLPPLGASGAHDLEQEAVAALNRHPSLVYFGGHGSRYLWELGDPSNPGSSEFFSRDDVGMLEPTMHPPIVISMSCDTAPFAHPSADSLGEVMVLSGDRGAVAFIGASAPLFTPPRFGELLVRELLKDQTLGDAFVIAKRRMDRNSISNLYNLLGDPALPLATLTPQEPDSRSEKQ